MKITATGLAWYRRENYDELRRISSDGATWAKTYDEWLKAAESIFNKFRAEGYTVYKVDIDPKAFPAWCAARGLNVDSRARIRFANEAVARMYLKPNS